MHFRQKYLSDRLLEDLAVLRRRGIKLFVCSGRAVQDFEGTGMLRGARFDGYVTLNGQFCCDEDGVPYRDRPIDPEDARGAYRVLMDNPGIPRGSTSCRGTEVRVWASGRPWSGTASAGTR